MSWLDATAVATEDKREVNPGALPEEDDDELDGAVGQRL